MRAAAALLFAMTAWSTAAWAGHWPIQGHFTIIDTTANLHYYGAKAGFHSGLVLAAKAGSKVYAPVTGKISTGYRGGKKQPENFQIIIETADGYRWQFRHASKHFMPKVIRTLAETGGTVQAGSLMATVGDFRDRGLKPQLRVDVTDPQGYTVDPRQFFPPIVDKTAPEIKRMLVVDGNNRVKVNGGNKSAKLSSRRSHELVFEAFDMIQPKGIIQGISEAQLEVKAGDKSVQSKTFQLQRLPKKSHLKGAGDIYKLTAVRDGKAVYRNRPRGGKRSYLFRFPLEPLPAGKYDLKLQVADFNGNKEERVMLVVVE